MLINQYNNDYSGVSINDDYLFGISSPEKNIQDSYFLFYMECVYPDNNTLLFRWVV